jgi:hypothetical protein
MQSACYSTPEGGSTHQSAGTGGSVGTGSGGKSSSSTGSGAGGSAAGKGGTGQSGSTSDSPLEDLTGAWDLVVTGDGVATDTIEISVDLLRVTTSKRELVLVRTSDGYDGTYEDGFVRATSREGEDLDPGALPLPIGGRWLLEDISSSLDWCDYTLSAASFSGDCTEGVYHAPDFPDLGSAVVTAVRVKALTSVFGDLGGEWTVETGEGARCNVLLDGPSLELSCQDAHAYSGSVSMVFSRDSLSGFTDRGIEFAAQRR